MEIRLHVTQKRLDELSVDDQIALEEWSDDSASTRQRRDLVARFVVDDKKDYLPEARARKLIGRLTTDEFAVVIREFMQKFSDMAVNPTKGGD